MSTLLLFDQLKLDIKIETTFSQTPYCIRQENGVIIEQKSITKGLLQIKWQPVVQFVRFRRVNIQRPRPPSYTKAKLIEVVKPVYPRIDKNLLMFPDPLRCKKKIEDPSNKKQIHNPYEVLLAKDLHNWFVHSKLVAFFHANTYNGEERFKMEVKLKKENMYLKVHAKSTVKMALQDTPFETVLSLFVSQTAMVFSAEPNVATLMKLAKKMPAVVLMAGIVEGRLMSYNQMVEYSQLNDLTTARAQLVSVLNSAQQQLVSGLTYHQNSIVSGLEQYASKEEKPTSQEGTADESTSSQVPSG